MKHKSLSLVAITLPFLPALLFFAMGCSRSDHHEAGQGSGAQQVTAIGIEHTACFGRCPVYTAMFLADGTVRYDGKMYVQRTGVHTGTVPREKFNQLAQLVIDSGFIRLKDDYSRPVTDNPSVITTVVFGGRKKIVRDYAGAGPNELDEIERRIDALLTEAQWNQPAGGAQTQPAVQ